MVVFFHNNAISSVELVSKGRVLNLAKRTHIKKNDRCAQYSIFTKR